MPEKRPKLLLAAYISPPGGGSTVGAWTVQALRDDYALTVLTEGHVDLDAVNDAFGTTLRRDDAEWITLPPAFRLLRRVSPLPLALLSLSLNMRYMRHLIRRTGFDAVISTMNEFDVGRVALQYIHYPWGVYPRPRVDYRWYHWGAAVSLYRKACSLVAGYDEKRAGRNMSFANSAWTARLFETLYREPCGVIYPPVVGGFPDIPLYERRNAFVIVGRFSPEKKLEIVMDIVAGVRDAGYEVCLTIIGQVDNEAYARRVRAEAAGHGDWVRIHESVSRSELVSLVAGHRFGIHGMKGEHFGIAPAELQLAGCLTFVPNDGGQTEIVDGDRRLTYSDPQDAVSKITAVLADARLERELRVELASRAKRFGEERFMDEIRDATRALILNQRGTFRVSDSIRPRHPQLPFSEGDPRDRDDPLPV